MGGYLIEKSSQESIGLANSFTFSALQFPPLQMKNLYYNATYRVAVGES